MLRVVNRLINQSTARAKLFIPTSSNPFVNGAFPLPSPRPPQSISVRFLDIYQLGSKEAIEKERARLADEMSRGYFADMADLKKHGGKVAAANKVMIPAAVAAKFPGFDVSFPDGTCVKLPVVMDGIMVMTPPRPPYFAFRFGLVRRLLVSIPGPVKRLLLRVTKKSIAADPNCTLQKQLVYSFGDHYYFRKELKILNLLTGYKYLLDKFRRIRWQGTGTATEEELSSLLSCTSLLLEEK